MMPTQVDSKTIKKQLHALMRTSQGPGFNKSSACLLPYKKEIYTLRFEHKASLEQIRRLFRQAGLTVSRNTLAYFCNKHFSVQNTNTPPLANASDTL